MKFAYKNIKAFTCLLQNNLELLSIQDRQTLADNIPEDIEELSEFILAWCQKRPEIYGALRKERKKLSNKLSDDKNKRKEFKNKQKKGFGFNDIDIKEEQEEREEYEANLRITFINALRPSPPPEKNRSQTPEADE